VVSNGIALGGLLVAVASWRGSRPRPPRVRIRHRDTVVELDGSPDEIRRLVDALDPPPTDPPPPAVPQPRAEPQPRAKPQPAAETSPTAETSPADETSRADGRE